MNPPIQQWKHIFSVAAKAGLPLLAAFLTACTTSQTYTLEEAPEMIVVKDFAPFYRVGPQQMQGPDSTMRLEERLRLLRKEFGYSLVQLEDGRSGYVPNENIAPAPPRPAIPETATRPTNDRNFTPYSGPPVDDMPLPDVELLPYDIPPPILIEDSEPVKKPEFRL